MATIIPTSTHTPSELNASPTKNLVHNMQITFTSAAHLFKYLNYLTTTYCF